jgi:hypothetical protein
MLAACGGLALVAGACESTESESARIGRESEAAARALATPHKSSHHRSHTSSKGKSAAKQAKP